MADLLLFPAGRRLGFIRRQVAAVATYASASRTRVVEHQLLRQHDAVVRLGFEPDEAAAYVQALRAEIYARLPSDRRSVR